MSSTFTSWCVAALAYRCADGFVADPQNKPRAFCRISPDYDTWSTRGRCAKGEHAPSVQQSCLPSTQQCNGCTLITRAAVPGEVVLTPCWEGAAGSGSFCISCA
jgi:hypothetical protein